MALVYLKRKDNADFSVGPLMAFGSTIADWNGVSLFIRKIRRLWINEYYKGRTDKLGGIRSWRQKKWYEEQFHLVNGIDLGLQVRRQIPINSLFQ
jgi:hypothetical protein